jgi:hypothetical protein
MIKTSYSNQNQDLCFPDRIVNMIQNTNKGGIDSEIEHTDRSSPFKSSYHA